MARIAIVGLGLIGGSLGLALHRVQTEHEIVGYDADRAAVKTAQRRGAIDRAADDVCTAVEGARLVILATPVLAVRDVLPVIGPHLMSGAIVTDTASTKSAVLEWAVGLPEAATFIGGHPMAGKETSGIEAADAALFDGATYCVVAGPSAPPDAVATVADLARAVGAEPYFVSAEEHDSFVAAISHLPFVLATALVTTTTSASSWRDMALLAAGGYRDTTRVAAGDPVMYRDICLTNRDAILGWLDAFARELGDLRALIAGGGDLEAAFARAKNARLDWDRRKREQAVGGRERAPGLGGRLGKLFLGGLDRRAPGR